MLAVFDVVRRDQDVLESVSYRCVAELLLDDFSEWIVAEFRLAEIVPPSPARMREDPGAVVLVELDQVRGRCSAGRERESHGDNAASARASDQVEELMNRFFCLLFDISTDDRGDKSANSATINGQDPFHRRPRRTRFRLARDRAVEVGSDTPTTVFRYATSIGCIGSSRGAAFQTSEIQGAVGRKPTREARPMAAVRHAA